MSFQPRTCVVLACDGPDGCDAWDGPAPHFDSGVQAVQYAGELGWTFPDGRALCRGCTADEVIADVQDVLRAVRR